MPVFAQLTTILLLLCLSFTAQAEKLRIVTEPWAPYVYEENGKILGLDYETTAIVFKRLGIDVEWQLLPWKRCLAMLEQGLADGALDIFQSDERDALLLYPSEPLSDVEFVMFYANARPHPFRTLDDLDGLTIGTSPGYLYSQAFRESTRFKRETAPTHEANFGKLQLGRIDLLITDRRVGRHVLNELRLGDQITENPVVVSRQSQYLAVRRRAGMDLLVQRFGAELKRFKHEPAYAELSARYGAIPVAKAAGQDAASR
ncbi:amino acid ABC transporter substrate-binding protein [Pseudomonas fluorescens]|jgi:polar amino acid transport system substrate-binding protein|uniref:Amino acid ABC transporter substrate-binding protein n=1 Tax=Pseudomonas frederiksbergensis TaxID=104087 RepID=A0A0B1Z768_9PSED|nr:MULTISPECIES: transporter substrate-binding domain-containing protein [Pseudomonas]KHK65173.1 amino acid ABC transporter substrate-binding protein [Pseudomonas frederiksbergensis]KJH81061.1 amino acid ABC transporter substrate-binding protein [Pseudomonas fluorescens]MBI6617309.1 transporter substrate-binding domain-containing protein [Pseudomonas corrugata]MBI6691861.1 transporter substrate-binding domain-containing protein [Pseudomonas corrugata]WRV68075.1 transporter substrate-binding do